MTLSVRLGDPLLRGELTLPVSVLEKTRRAWTVDGQGGGSHRSALGKTHCFARNAKQVQNSFTKVFPSVKDTLPLNHAPYSYLTYHLKTFNFSNSLFLTSKKSTKPTLKNKVMSPPLLRCYK